MQLRFVRQQRGRIRFGLIYGTIVLCMLAAARLLPLSDLMPPCAFRWLTGISCPTCGATRAVQRLAAGEVAASLSWNPLFILLLLSLLVWMALDVVQLLVKARMPVLIFETAESTALRAGVALLFFGNWIYLVLSHT